MIVSVGTLCSLWKVTWTSTDKPFLARGATFIRFVNGKLESSHRSLGR